MKVRYLAMSVEPDGVGFIVLSSSQGAFKWLSRRRYCWSRHDHQMIFEFAGELWMMDYDEEKPYIGSTGGETRLIYRSVNGVVTVDEFNLAHTQ